MSIDYSKPVKITLIDRISYWAFLGFELILRIFPLAFWCLMGRLTGLLVWSILPKYRRLVRRNMRIIFAGQKSSEELRQLVKDNFQTIFCNFIASAKAATMSDKALARHFTVIGKEHVLTAMEKHGNGVICAISHMGNWELLARVRMCFTEVTRYGSMYRELDNPLMEKLWCDRRQKSGCEMFGKKTSTFADSTKILRDNGMLGILCDQNAGNYGVMVPYYGKMTSTTNLPALLQRRTKAQIVTTTVRTTGLAQWEVTFSPPLDLPNQGKNLIDTTAKINYVLAEYGRKSPADGFWMHNRWKQETILPRGEKIDWLTSPYGAYALPFRILVSMPHSLDEAMLFIPTMQAISEVRKDAEWNILCPADQKDFWNKIPWITSISAKEGNLDQILGRLNGSSPIALDFAYLLDGDKHVYKALVKLSGVVLRALEGEHPKIKSSRQVISILHDKKHRVYDYGEFARAAQITSGIESYLPYNEKNDPGPNAPIIVCPFSSLGKTSELSKSFWAKFNKKRPYPLTLVALERDAERADQWARDLGLDCYIMSMEAMMEELAEARLLIAVDGMVPYMAARVGTPTITLLAERDPERYAPLGGSHQYIKIKSVDDWDEDHLDELARQITAIIKPLADTSA